MVEHREIELRHHFDDELDEIRTHLVETGTIVLAKVRLAGRAVVENRLGQVEVLEDGDRPINHRCHELEAKVLQILAQLTEASARMFERGIDAITTMDPAIGHAADDEGETTDSLTSELFSTVTARQEHLELEASVGLFYMGRFLERIADHGVNISQNITFAVSARFPDDE